MPLMEGYPWDNIQKILQGGQTMARVQNGKEILPKVSTGQVGCRNVTHDRQMDL